MNAAPVIMVVTAAPVIMALPVMTAVPAMTAVPVMYFKTDDVVKDTPLPEFKFDLTTLAAAFAPVRPLRPQRRTVKKVQVRLQATHRPHVACHHDSVRVYVTCGLALSL